MHIYVCGAFPGATWCSTVALQSSGLSATGHTPGIGPLEERNQLSRARGQQGRVQAGWEVLG